MTFIDALKTGRPMRRKSPVTTYSYPWLYLGKSDKTPYSRACWREVETGQLAGLSSSEYIAEDWEVMP